MDRKGLIFLMERSKSKLCVLRYGINEKEGVIFKAVWSLKFMTIFPNKLMVSDGTCDGSEFIGLFYLFSF